MRPAEADAFLAGLADAMIREKDAIDPDPDLEPNGDEEPGLGAPEVEYRLGDYGGPPVARGHIDQRRWADGSSDEAEAVDEDGGDINDGPQDEATQDLEPEVVEPTLGSIEGVMDQRSWSAHCDASSGEAEPSLGAPENPHDQTRWAQGRKGSREGDHDERSDFSRFGSQQHQARRLAREQARTLVQKSRKRILPKSSFVEFRPGVLHVVGGARG